MKETLEEAAEKVYPNDGFKDEIWADIGEVFREKFIEGAKWQAEQDKNEAIEFAKWLEKNSQQREYYPMVIMSMEELFEQFKK